MRAAFLPMAVIAAMVNSEPVLAATYNLSPPQSIQTAIDTAEVGDVIVLSQGTYTETINFNGKAVTVRSSNPDDWDVIEATIIDANGEGDVVTFENGESSSALLWGLTVKGGDNAWHGGGIICGPLAAPTIKNCLITDNEGDNGAGFYCTDGAHPTLNGCRIIDNKATLRGGGAFIKESTPTFINCSISNNDAGWTEDGIVCGYKSSTIITGCSITKHQGAGLRSESDAVVSLINCVIAENRPGLFFTESSHLDARHCTIVRNRGTSLGSGLYFFDDGVRQIKNSIIWNRGPEVFNESGTMEITYSCIQGGWPGTGNINALPDFVNANDGDYHLLDGSPCIDWGYPSVGVNSDLDGNPRPGTDGLVDMGAFESPAGFLPGSLEHEPQVIYVGVSDATPTGESWSSALPTIAEALDVSNTSDEIWVRSGEYPEPVDLEPFVQLYGGFAGTETSRSEQDFSQNPTVINGTGYVGRVVTLAEDSLVDGFTIEKGIAYVYDVTATIRNCVIRNSSSPHQGGGLYAFGGSLTITGCTIEHCQSEKGGGALFNSCKEVALGNCRIVDNTATYSGGGFVAYQTPVRLMNCIIARNRARDGGAAVATEWDCSLSVTHCTLVDNRVTFTGGLGGCIAMDGPIQVVNSIFWNMGREIVSDGTKDVRYSCLQSGWTGEGNIDGFPEFLDRAGGDYHLGEGSSCVDRGLPIDSSSQDIDGNPRPGEDGLVDIGAYESLPASIPGPATHTPTVIYVDSGASEAGDGSGWDSPLLSINDAYLISNTSDEIWVKAGTYPEGILSEPTTILLGGFVGTETNSASRLWKTHPTILDGNSLDSTPIVMSGECTVDGFTITGGTGDEGGGVRILEGTGVLSNCIIRGNMAEYGGGIFVESSGTPLIEKCSIQGNAAGVGGGIYANGHPRIEDCTFENNSSQTVGGGVCFEGSGELSSCLITGNSTGFEGGGVWLFGNGYVSDCLVYNNSAVMLGGGIGCYVSSAHINRCQLIGNWADKGGGFSCRNTSSMLYSLFSRPVVSNCLMTENQANSGTAIFAGYRSIPSFVNCTVAGNIPDATEGTFAVESKVVASITNCIFWNGGYEFVGDSTPVVTYSDIQGGYPGAGNIHEEPLFVDSLGRDYHLLPLSPCIGKGVGPSLDLEVPLIDIDGDPRSGNVCDIGADEFTGPTWIQIWPDY